MSGLSYRLFLRKKGVGSSIMAVALLVTVLASMNSVVNHISFQAQALGTSVNVGKAYLILGRDSTSLTGSTIDAEITNSISNHSAVSHILPQRTLRATLTTANGSHTILVRGVEDVTSFLKTRRAHINGTRARSGKEANMGEILARAASVHKGEEANLTVDGTTIRIQIVGVITTQTEIDRELIMPLEATSLLTEDRDKISFIEFRFKDQTVTQEAVTQLSQILPETVKVVKAQQPLRFLQKTNSQTVAFLNLWSLTVYAVVAAASYLVATRLVAESSYELGMLKALGAGNRLLFTVVLAYTGTMALIGSALGIALGIAGSQTISTMLTWIESNAQITPFLSPEQALTILSLTFLSSTLGGLCPAFRSARTVYGRKES